VIVLGLETSCDETGVALLDSERGVLAHALHTQVDMHRDYGGVVPELASRDHIRRLLPLVQQALAQAGISRRQVDAIAVTAGPGLVGALLVGASFGHALGFALGRPVIDVHHMEGHLLSPLLAQPGPQFPFIALLVSGGHTQLMQVEGFGAYRLLGETQRIGVELYFPPPELCTDNGAMIAYAGWQRLRAGQVEPLAFGARARWAMDSLPATPPVPTRP